MTLLDLDPKDDFLRLEPYLDDFAEAALAEGEDTALLCGLTLRETWAGWAPGFIVPPGAPRHLGRGDGGHGFGLFQIDDRGPYAHLPREAPEATPHQQARWACTVLRDARQGLRDLSLHPMHDRAVISVYNAGLTRVRNALLLGHDPDSVTTPGGFYKVQSGQARPGDYGADVLHRRDELRAAHPERFPLPWARIA